MSDAHSNPGARCRPSAERLIARAPRALPEGFLTEPAYFDFISFVQYATIATTMKEPKMIFDELIDANGTHAYIPC